MMLFVVGEGFNLKMAPRTGCKVMCHSGAPLDYVQNFRQGKPPKNTKLPLSIQIISICMF